MLYLADDEDATVSDSGFVTWYDARVNHPTRSEFRLYFQSSSVMEQAAEGDLLFIGRRLDDTLMLVVARQGSTVESQLLWLFDIDGTEVADNYVVKTETGHDNIGLVERLILEELGIEVDDSDDSYLEEMLTRFGNSFPPTVMFSQYARETIPEISATDEPDSAIVEWIAQEETLFRTLERHFVQSRLDEGFSDVDDFVSYSLSVQNRRKSRMGHALEHHLNEVFVVQNVEFDRGKKTEGNKKPDFLFPGATAYHNAAFPDVRLTMLGAKSTCKDRWRQVLSEANRIERKHLLTLEPSISENQTDEMQGAELQLVVPRPIHATFTINQQGWLMDANSFIELVRSRQAP